uniref:THAP domain containing 3 n=1 Tax=Oryctolagus cuniculus TaxID=9986 RepID=G1SW03_RABIT
MPKSCAARLCCNRYGNCRKQLTFHRFPFSRPELLKEWVLNIGRANFKPKKHTVICSEHFSPECFSAFGNRKNLKHNAVPTVFAFQDPTQLVRENTDPGGGAAAAPERRRPPEPGKRPRPGQGAVAGCSPREHTVPLRSARPPGPGRLCARSGWTARPVPSAGAGRPLPPGSPQRPLASPQVWPQRPDAPGRAAGPAGLRRPLPRQPSDHSYALLDLDALKKKLFLTLKENEKLRRRLKAQRLVMRRMRSRLRAPRAGRRGPRPGAQPEQRS